MYLYLTRNLRRLLAIVGVASLAAIALIPMGRAEAVTTCQPSTHCYAIAYWPSSGASGSGWHGEKGEIRTNCQIVDDAVTDFTDNETWFVKGSYWVEVGVTTGLLNGTVYRSPEYFWADNRPNGGGYHEHAMGAAPLNTYVQTSIVPGSSSGRWDAHIGSYVGGSGSNFTGAADTLETGTETTSNLNRSYGSTRNLAWMSVTNQWYTNGWSSSGSSGHAVLSVTDTGGAAQMHANWADAYSWVQDGQHATC